MVLEWLLEARNDRKHPFNIFVFGVIAAAISMFISYTVFKDSTGLFTVFLVSLASVPFINKMLAYEEVETEKTGEIEGFWDRHGDVIMAFAALFLGMTIAMSIAYVALPESVSQIAFDAQIKELRAIQSSIVGNF